VAHGCGARASSRREPVRKASGFPASLGSRASRRRAPWTTGLRARAGTADRAAAAYRRRAIRLGIEDRVVFIGACANVERLFGAVDGLAIPSLFEPFGNVVMEAMAAGLPALCSKLTGAAELIPRELSQLVIDDPTDIGALARGVSLLLRLGSDASKVARATAEQYTWQRYGTELLEIISKTRLFPGAH